MTTSRSPNGATHDNGVDKYLDKKQIRIRLCDEGREALTYLTQSGTTAIDLINHLLIAQAAKETSNDKLLQSKKQVQTIIQEKQAHA